MRIDISLLTFRFVLELYKGWYCVEFGAIVFLAERMSAIDANHFVGKSEISRNGSAVFDIGHWQLIFENGKRLGVST